MAQSGAATRGAQATGRAKTRPASAAQRRSGRGLRNSDLAFLFVGLVLVAGLVWLVLSSSSTGSITNNAANTGLTGNTGGAPAASNSGASRNAGKEPQDFIPVAAGEQAPDFTLPDADGKTYTLSQFKGKTVVLEFLATWCPHCQNDAPIMNQLSEAYKDKDVQVLGVNASQFGRNYQDQKDPSPVTIDDIKWFRDTYTVTFPLLFDPNVDVGINYGVKGYPTVYIIKKDGTVSGQPKYPFKYEDLVAAVEKALK
jgi:peroxiredoxin